MSENEKHLLSLRNEHRRNKITELANRLEPTLDWGQIQSEYDEAGEFIGLTSQDPKLAEWLRQIRIQT